MAVAIMLLNTLPAPSTDGVDNVDLTTARAQARDVATAISHEGR
jgi:hypothetical protein